MAEVENLHFKIGLAGTYWDKHPQYSILLNDQVIKQDTVKSSSAETFYVEFDSDIQEKNILKIRLENKHWSDTVQNEDKTHILKDMMLHVKSVEIDEITLGEILWSKTQFVGDDSDRPILNKCVDLGWNGTWELAFTGPFYLWLIDNL